MLLLLRRLLKRCVAKHVLVAREAIRHRYFFPQAAGKIEPHPASHNMLKSTESEHELHLRISRAATPPVGYAPAALTHPTKRARGVACTHHRTHPRPFQNA